MELIHQFNKYSADQKSLISKALSSATGAGEALVPQNLEKIITNAVVQLSAELAVVQPELDKGKLHEFNRITALPSAGGAMGESAVTPTRNSSFTRDSVRLKVIRRKGAVTNFLQDTSEDYINAAAAEMENHILAHTYDLAYYNMWGNAGANEFEYSGWDRFISTFRRNDYNPVTNLKVLDDMIDNNSRRQGQRHKKAFFMSPEMLSKMSALLTNVRLNQGLQGAMSIVEINGGWRLNAYRDIPIIESTGTRPIGTMGTVVATAGTSGTLATATYYFRVAPVTYKGEQAASAEASAAVTGPTGSVALTFTAFTGSNNDALAYRVYASTATGTEKLIKIVPAFTYDGNGTVTGSVTSITITTMSLNDSVSTAMGEDKPLLFNGTTPQETIWLIDLDKYQGMGKMPYTNSAGSRFQGLVTTEPLAKTDDDLPFLIKTYGAICPAFEATSAVTRGVSVA